MGSLIAEIFSKNTRIDVFSEEVIKLNGVFSFKVEDMQELGKKYFEIYPDSTSNRNAEEIQIGYKMVRVCILEKIISDFPVVIKSYFREIFFKPVDVSQIVTRIVGAVGKAGAYGYYETMTTRLNEMKTVIDLIPKGMVKERFVGGITNLFNVLYIIKISIDKIKA